MAETKTTTKAPKQSKRQKFVCSGNNQTVVLAGSRNDIIYNKMGDPIAKKHIGPIQIVFQGGYAETEDETVVELLVQHKDFGKTIFWHPTCLPGDAEPHEKALAARLAGKHTDRLIKIKRGIEKAREGGIPRE